MCCACVPMCMCVSIWMIVCMYLDKCVCVCVCVYVRGCVCLRELSVTINRYCSKSFDSTKVLAINLSFYAALVYRQRAGLRAKLSFRNGQSS